MLSNVTIGCYNDKHCSLVIGRDHKGKWTEHFKKWNSSNISFSLETSVSQNFHQNLNVVHFFNTSVNWTSVSACDNFLPALVSNKCFYLKRPCFKKRVSDQLKFMFGNIFCFKLWSYNVEAIIILKNHNFFSELFWIHSYFKKLLFTKYS